MMAESSRIDETFDECLSRAGLTDWPPVDDSRIEFALECLEYAYGGRAHPDCDAVVAVIAGLVHEREQLRAALAASEPQSPEANHE